MEETTEAAGRTGYGRLVLQPKITSKSDSKPGSILDGGSLLFLESTVTDIESSYPLKLMVPENASSSHCQWVYPVSYGGGLVEGDAIHLAMELGTGCCALLTTQSSTKVYHCLEGQTTRQTMKYRVGSGAFLAVLPDPTVPYKDSIYQQSQEVVMETDSNLVLVDWVTAGRVARGELWDFTRFGSSVKVTIGDQVVFRDAVKLQDTPQLTVKQAMNTYQVQGVMVVIGKALEQFQKDLLAEYGKAKAFEAQLSSDTFLGVSPVSYRVGGVEVPGCIVKLCTQSTSEAFKCFHRVLLPLLPTFGGNPFEKKY